MKPTATKTEWHIALTKEVEKAVGRLKTIPDAQAAWPIAVNKWSRKEILGHLCDSAINNYSRFIQLQISEGLFVVENYAQSDWVRLADYHHQTWVEILERWQHLNRGIARLLEGIEKSGLYRQVLVEGEVRPVSFLVDDYLRHMCHHLRQMVSDED